MTRFSTPILLVVFVSLSVSAPADSIAWSPPLPVAPDTLSYGHQYGHSMGARDTALWAMWFDTREPGWRTLRAARFSNETWTEPESIYGDTWYAVHEVSAAVAADLTPWAAWGVSRWWADSSYCMWSHRRAGAWTAPDYICQDSSESDYSVDITPDPVQGVWAAWERPVSESWVVFLSARCAGDTWTRPARIHGQTMPMMPFDPKITAPPLGPPRTVWLGFSNHGEGLHTAVWDGDSWTGLELIPGSWGYRPSVCSDSAGGTWVAWSNLDTVLCAHHDGNQWHEPVQVGSGTMPSGRMLCCDHRGRVWVMWEDDYDMHVRYHDGASWSDPSVVVTDVQSHHLYITAALDRVWVTWSRLEPSGRRLLYYRYTLPTGLAERNVVRLEGIRVSGSIVRLGADLRLTGLPPGARVELLDASGRVRLTTHSSSILWPSSVSPGAYFIRVSTGSQSAVRKVLVVE